MKIQTYETPRVTQQGIPGGEAPLTENLLTKAAPYAQKAVGLVAEAKRLADEAKKKADTYKAEDAYNKLQAKKTELWAEVQTKQGENASNVQKEYLAKYDEEADLLKSKMGGGAADMFSQAHARGKLAFDSQLSAYQTGQIEASKEKTNLAGITLEMNEARANAGTPVADQNLARGRFLLDQEASRRGLAGDAKSLFMLEGLSQAHSGVVQGLLDKQYPVAAQEYLKTHDAEFTRKDFKALNALTEKDASGQQVQGWADQIEAENPADKDKRARELAKNPALLAALRNEQDYRAGKRKERMLEQSGTFMAMYTGLNPQKKHYSRSQIEHSPAYLALSDSGKVHLDNLMDAEDARNRAQENPTDTINRYVAFSEFVNGDALAKMTPQQIAGMGFGTQLTIEALHIQQQNKVGFAKLGNVSVPASDYNSLKLSWGIPLINKKDKMGNARSTAFDAEFSRRGAVKQAELKRPMNEMEIQDLFSTMAKEVKVTTKDDGWFGLWDSTDTKQRWEVEIDFMGLKVTPEEAELAALILVNQDIPVNEMTLKPIIDRLRDPLKVVDVAKELADRKKGMK